MSRDVNFGDQDTLRLCQTINTSIDGEAERTEYFTVALRRPRSGIELASCQVAILDRNGGEHRVFLVKLNVIVYPYSMAGPSDCYENAVANASLGRIINDRA